MIEHVNPDTVAASEYFDQATILRGPLVVVGGQNGIDRDGTMLEGIAAQAEQAMRNLLAVLEAAGSGPEHVGRLGIQVTVSADLRTAQQAAMAAWGDHRTAVVVSIVQALARPDALVEIDALACVATE